MTRAAPGHDNHRGLGRTKDKRSNATEKDRHAFYYSASFPPIIKPLINSPVCREITQGHSWLQCRQLSTSKWGKCLSVHLLSSSLTPSFFCWYSPWGLLILMLGEMPAPIHLILCHSPQGNHIFTLFCELYYWKSSLAFEEGCPIWITHRCTGFEPEYGIVRNISWKHKISLQPQPIVPCKIIGMFNVSLSIQTETYLNISTTSKWITINFLQTCIVSKGWIYLPTLLWSCDFASSTTSKSNVSFIQWNM